MAENEKHSSVRAFNDAFPDTPFQSFVDGRVDVTAVGTEQTEALKKLFSLHPGRYTDFMAQAQENFEIRQNEVSASAMSTDAIQRMKNRSQEKINIVRNMEVLQDIMASNPTPSLSQKVGINYGHLLTPFTVNKEGSPMYSQAGQTQRLMAYYASARSSAGGSPPVVQNNILNDIMNSDMLPAGADGRIEFQQGTIWNHLDAPAATPAYSGAFSVNAQSYIEKFRDFSATLSNPTSRNGFIALDIETFGDLSKNDWFHTNEIAANKFERGADGTFKSTQAFSWLNRTSDTLANEMSQTLAALRDNPLQFGQLSEARQRSLVDLMRYSTSPTPIGESGIAPAQFLKDGTNVNVVHSNALDLNQLYAGKKLNQNVLVDNFTAYSDHMYSGLNNLRSEGTSDAIQRYNQLVETNKDLYFITHNGDAFDIKGLEASGGVAPAKHLDWLKLEQSVFPTGYMMQDAYGRSQETGYREGPWTLQEHRRSFGWDTGQGHIGAYDVGEFGTGGIVLQTKDIIGEHIEDAKVTGELDRTGLRRKGSVLSYSEDPLRQGQSLFATSSVRNYSGNYADFQAEIVDGQLERINPEFNRNVLDAESFYTVNGIRQTGEGRFALELVNEATDTYSYIVRDGANARAEIAQFVQQHLEVADEMMDEGKPLIRDLRMNDLARRRYEDVMGLRQGSTKGFEAAKRLFDNVRIFNEEVSGPEGPRSQAQLAQMMDFNSLRNGSFNASEAEQFWRMLPRLQSEYPVFSGALAHIEESIPMRDDMSNWQRRDVNMQRSLALRRFSAEVDTETGGAPVETRDALPYEKHVLSFEDRVTGRPQSLNLRDTASAYQGTQNYIYSGVRKETDPARRAQMARENYLTLVTNLEENQYMTRSQADLFINDFQNMENPSPSVHAKTLALELSNNLAILNQVEQDKITSTSLSARAALKNLDTATVVQMTENASSFARNVYGQKVVSGNSVKPTLTPELSSLFEQLDVKHPVTGLEPNHRQAVGGLLERFMSMGKNSHNIGFAVTTSMDNNLAYLNIFHETNTTSVLSHLEAGNSTIHPQAVRVSIPLIGANGTMRYNNMQINAESMIVRGANGLERVSSVQQVADMYTPGVVKTILQDIQGGNLDRPQQIANRTTGRAVSHLANIVQSVGGTSDSMIFENTDADAYKQGRVNVVPAMARDYLDSGQLTPEHFRDNMVPDGQITARDLKPSGMEVIDRNKLEWVRSHGDELGFDPDMSSVKSDNAAGYVGTVSAREATFAGMATPHTRDNSVQLANSYAFNQHLQKSLGEIDDGTYLNFNETTTTPLGRELSGRRPDGSKATVKIKTALMSDQEIQRRLGEMIQTPEGFELMKQEGIINEAGEYDPVRTPTVYEQQIVMNKEIQSRLKMTQHSFFNLDEDPDVIDDFIKEKNGTKFFEDGRIGVRYTEDVHKIFLDFEKGTFGAGGGFSLRFLEALTGVKGVGAIYGPDVAKHKDFSSLYRGHMNRVADAIQEMEGKDRSNAIRRVGTHFANWETGALGLTVTDMGDHINIDEHWKAAGITEVDNAAFLAMMDDVGVTETVDSAFGPTTTVTQDLSIARVSNYAEAVGSQEGRVRYGPRELDILRRQGATATAEYIANVIDRSADTTVRPGEMSVRAQALSILDAGRAMQTGENQLLPGPNDRIWNPNEFNPKPIVDNNRATYARTIIDSDWVQGQTPGNSTGAWVQLPKVSDELSFQIEGQKVEKVFLPYTQMQGKGNDVWKTDLQRINENIIDRAQKLENMPRVDEKGFAVDPKNARDALQRELDNLNQQIRTDISSSKGFIGTNVLKGQMPNSATGLTKIIPPELSKTLGGSFTYISTVDAERLGVANLLAEGKDFYVPDLRYPSFHDDALRMTKLRMSDQLPEGHQLISADVAEKLRADSDGDMNHILAVQDEAVQEDMRKTYMRQQREARILGQSLEGSDHQYNLRELGNVEERPGTVQLYDAHNASVAYDEFAAKYGKQLVGQASNLNYQYSHLAMQYGGAVFGDREDEAVRQMATFFSGPSGLEQKIISAKHGNAGAIDNQLRNPALQLIEALQTRQWTQALSIDQNLLGGMFTEKAMMGEAIANLQILEQHVPQEEMKNVSRQFGLSGGAPDTIRVNGEERVVTMNALLDIVDGRDEARLASNQTVAGLNRLADASEASPAVSLPETVEPEPVSRAPYAYVPQHERVPRPINVLDGGIQYQERGLSKLGSVLEGAMHSRIGVGVGIGAGIVGGVLAFSNLTSAETATPESRPHNNEEIQDAHSGGNGAGMSGGTARVEENGRGLNGLQVRVSGTAPGHLSNDQIGGFANQALNSSGIQSNINIRSQDDSSSIDQSWLQEKFKELLVNGSVGH